MVIFSYRTSKTLGDHGKRTWHLFYFKYHSMQQEKIRWPRKRLGGHGKD